MSNCILFCWQALNPGGDICEGRTLATSRQQLIESLQAEGIILLNIRRKKYFTARYWKWRDRILLFSQTGILLQAGLPLAEGLQLLARGHPARAWQSLLHQLQQQILAGTPLSVALKAWPQIFPPLCAALIHAGEQTGQLEYCCKSLAEQQQRYLLLKNQIIKALRYPLFILLLTLVISSGMLLWVLPEFAAIYHQSGTPLPAFTRQLITLSEQSLHFLLPVLLFSSICGGLLLILLKKNLRWQSACQRYLLRLPLAGTLWQATLLARIFSILALTQRAGLPLSTGLRITGELQTTVLWRQAISDLQSHIEQGLPLSSGLKQQPAFPPLCYLLTHLGEQTGTLDVLFSRLSEWYEAAAAQKASALSSSIEPVMLTITGIITGAIVIAMYLPMFSLGEAIM